VKTRLPSVLRRHEPLSRDNPTKNLNCSDFEVDNWAISRFVSERLVPVAGIHPFPLHELMLMTAAVCRFEPSEIFEWGTHIGKSARVFYEITSHYRIDAALHSTDLPDDVEHVEHPHADRGRMVRGLPRVHLHQGDGLDTSLALWRAGGRRPQPLFFLDGDHSRESVFRELTGVTLEIPDAAILVHDAFYQSPASGYNIGPYEAIEDVLASVPGRYRKVHSGLGLPGMTLLYPTVPVVRGQADAALETVTRA
jgi:cephalosporin hydroxylase